MWSVALLPNGIQNQMVSSAPRDLVTKWSVIRRRGRGLNETENLRFSALLFSRYCHICRVVSKFHFTIFLPLDYLRCMRLLDKLFNIWSSSCKYYTFCFEGIRKILPSARPKSFPAPRAPRLTRAVTLNYVEGITLR